MKAGGKATRRLKAELKPKARRIRQGEKVWLGRWRM